MIKGFLFDLDGTIWDSRAAFLQSLEETIYTLKHKKIQTATLHGLLSSMTPLEILKLYRVERTEFFWRRFQEKYFLIKLFFDDTLSILVETKRHGKKLGVVTSLKKQIALDILAKFNLVSVFSSIVTPSSTPARKPSPKPLFMAMNDLDLAENEVVYIGDQEIDMVAAKRARCYAALAEWGNTREVSVVPDYRLRRLSDVLSLCGE